MKHLATIAMCIGFAGATFYLVNAALTDMTAQDCYVNKIQRACEALE